MDRGYASRPGFKTKQPCRWAPNCSKGDKCQFSHALQGQRQPFATAGRPPLAAGWRGAFGSSGDFHQYSPQTPEQTMQWFGAGGPGAGGDGRWTPPWLQDMDHASFHRFGRQSAQEMGQSSLHRFGHQSAQEMGQSSLHRFGRQSMQDRSPRPTPIDAAAGSATVPNTLWMYEGAYLSLRRDDTPSTDIPDSDLLLLSRQSTQDRDTPWQPWSTESEVRKATSQLDQAASSDGAPRQGFDAPSGQSMQEDGSPLMDGVSNRSKRNKFYKRRMCKYYAVGQCQKGAACNFGHSPDELKPLPNLRCTKLCPELLESGACSKGEGCRYAHSNEELREDESRESRKARLHGPQHSAEEEAQAPQEARGTEPLGEGMWATAVNPRCATWSPTPVSPHSIGEEPYVGEQVDGDDDLGLDMCRYFNRLATEPSPCPSWQKAARASLAPPLLRFQDNQGPPMLLTVKNTFLTTELPCEPSSRRSQSARC